MKIQTNRFNLQSSRFWLKTGLALTLAVAMVGVVVFFVFAATVPVITAFPAGVEGGWVQVRIDNLPADTDYVVYEGIAGSQGMDGYKIAGFNSQTGGSLLVKFELAAELYDEKTIDVRIDDGKGNVAYATIPNPLVPTPVVVNTASGVVNVPVTGATATPLATLAAGVTGTPEATVAATVAHCDCEPPPLRRHSDCRCDHRPIGNRDRCRDHRCSRGRNSDCRLDHRSGSDRDRSCDDCPGSDRDRCSNDCCSCDRDPAGDHRPGCYRDGCPDHDCWSHSHPGCSSGGSYPWCCGCPGHPGYRT